MSDDVVIRLPAEFAGKLRTACDAGYLLDASARVFGLLRSGLSTGSISLDDAGAVLALAELAERALDEAANREGDELARFAMHLDDALRDAGPAKAGEGAS